MSKRLEFKLVCEHCGETVRCDKTAYNVQTGGCLHLLIRRVDNGTKEVYARTR